MPTTVTISLPDELGSALDDQVAKGGYASRDEYVSDLIRRDQARAGRDQLESELAARADDSNSVVMDAADFQAMRRELHRRLGQAEPR